MGRRIRNTPHRDHPASGPEPAPRMATNSASTPAFENSMRVQIGEPEENKLQRAIIEAAKYGGIGAAMGLGGAAVNSMLFEADQASKRPWDRRMTEAQHAVDNAGGYDEAPEDYAIYEGIRQGLIGGAITPTDVNRMIIEGQLSPRAELLVSDIHDHSGPELSVDPRGVAAMIDESGGDGLAYLQRQQALRNEMGIEIPI